MNNISRVLGEKLLARKLLISVAESCTGGLVCKLITDVAGSSQWFDRGFITYTNQAKIDLLNVPSSILNNHGAVSLATVEAMASGVLASSQSQISIAISGVAGPGGGSAEKPVGTVCFGWLDHNGNQYCEAKLFSGDRNSVREQAAIYAMEGVIRHFLDFE